MLGSLGVLAVWAVEAVVLVMDRERGPVALVKTQAQVTSAAQRIEQLQKESRDLSTRSAALKRDPRAVEAAAREVLGMVYPGELVLLLPEEDAAPGRP
jgi:cell division protein FtsB